MKTFRYYISMSVSGSKCEDVFSVEDDATEEEIEETAREYAFGEIDWGYEEVDE